MPIGATKFDPFDPTGNGFEIGGAAGLKFVPNVVDELAFVLALNPS
jgi:hypothetical protein